ncbi:hypothetical protein GEMRC1_000225 [Eukaryota sp. GEM-RC1]
MLEDLPSIKTIGASYRLFPHLIRDTSEFLRITNSSSTSAIISVSSGSRRRPPRPDISLAPPNFDHVGIHDNAGYYSPCTDPAHPDEGPFDIMIATLDDARAIEPELEEDNLFAKRLTIDHLAHDPLSSSDSDLREETSWSQIPDPSYVF